MKVYCVVEFDAYLGPKVRARFSRREHAEDFVRQYCHDDKSADLRIEPWEVDRHVQRD